MIVLSIRASTMLPAWTAETVLNVSALVDILDNFAMYSSICVSLYPASITAPALQVLSLSLVNAVLSSLVLFVRQK
jgi:hypothetical protein